jgi:hypothetical protein
VEGSVTEILMNYGAMGIMLVWFMFKNSKDMESFKSIIQKENEQTREVMNDLKIVIAKLGGVESE